MLILPTGKVPKISVENAKEQLLLSDKPAMNLLVHEGSPPLGRTAVRSLNAVLAPTMQPVNPATLSGNTSKKMWGRVFFIDIENTLLYTCFLLILPVWI